MSKQDPLASLRGGASAPASSDSIVTVGDRVLIDYDGKTGPEQQFAHTGDLVLIDGGRPLRLQPGLNMPPRDVWEHYKSHPKIETLRMAGALRVVSPDLREYPTRTTLLGLVKRTLCADALDYMLALEKAKPHNGPGSQDPRILELLEHRAKAAARSRGPDLGNVVSMASQHAATLTVDLEARMAKAAAKAG